MDVECLPASLRASVAIASAASRSYFRFALLVSSAAPTMSRAKSINSLTSMLTVSLATCFPPANRLLLDRYHLVHHGHGKQQEVAIPHPVKDVQVHQGDPTDGGCG